MKEERRPKRPTLINLSTDSDQVQLPPESLTVRFAVASQIGGRTGMVQIPIDVPKPSATGVQCGGILFGRIGDEPNNLVGADRIQGRLPFLPTAARAFTTSDTLRVFGPLFSSGDAVATHVSIDVTAGRRTLRTINVSQVPIGSQTNRGQTDFAATIPLEGLSPGAYALRVSARLPTGKESWRAIAIEVK